MMATPRLPAVERLGHLLAAETGQTLSESRRWRIETLLQPLLRARGLRTLDALLLAIEDDRSGRLKAEAIDAMLNHESSFFRDIGVFQAIEDVVLPRLAAATRDRALRIWCIGCSTGQEAYSLAMIVARSPALAGWRVAIEASDVSPLAVEKAKAGRFSQMDMQRGLPIGELLRWFTPVANEWVVADEIRRMVTFRTESIIAPRAAGPFDLVLCRNVLFYFPEAQRQQACAQIARRVRPGGYLVLGAGEMLTGTPGFSACRDMSCVYAAGPAPVAAASQPFAAPPAAAPPAPLPPAALSVTPEAPPVAPPARAGEAVLSPRLPLR